MKLRLGLVGLGPGWEHRYRPALRALSDRFEVCAVCDPVALRASQVASEFGATAIDGYRALAHREDVDAMLVLSRQWFGALPILAACDEGKAVYCANGLECDVELTDRLKSRIEKSGVAFMAAFARRHAPATLRLKELIATRLGPAKLLFCHLRRSMEAHGANGRCPQAGPESPLKDLVELVDWCRYVVDRDPVSVVGMAHGLLPTSFDGDYEMMSLSFPSGNGSQAPVVAQISCGRYMPADWHEAVTFRPPAALQVTCERGIAFVDLPSTVVWFDSAGRHMESLDSERPVGETLLLHFHRSVTSLVRDTSNLQDAWRALTITAAARQSHEEGRRITLPT